MMMSSRIENTNSRTPVPLYIFGRPGLLRTQQLTLDARAKVYYGQPTFSALLDGALLEPPSTKQQDEMDFCHTLLVGGVYPITLSYFGGYTPPEPKDHDISQATFMGGHAQPHVLVTAAMVTRRISINQVEVRLDTPVMLGSGSGPRTRLDRYILHRDGSVRYWQSKLTYDNALHDIDYGTDVVCEYNTLCPCWEYTHFPVLPSVVFGV